MINVITQTEMIDQLIDLCSKYQDKLFEVSTAQLTKADCSAIIRDEITATFEEVRYEFVAQLLRRASLDNFMLRVRSDLLSELEQCGLGLDNYREVHAILHDGPWSSSLYDDPATSLREFVEESRLLFGEHKLFGEDRTI